MSFFNSVSRILKSTAIYTLSIVPVALAVDHSILSVAYVQGKSMAPTLNASPHSLRINGQRGPNSHVGVRTTHTEYAESNEIVVVRKLAYEPVRGDVIVLDSPGKPGEQAIKRLVAMEGDVILYLSPTHTKPLFHLPHEIERKRIEEEWKRAEEERIREYEEIEERFRKKMEEAEDVGKVMEEMNEYFRVRQENAMKEWMDRKKRETITIDGGEKTTEAGDKENITTQADTKADMTILNTVTNDTPNLDNTFPEKQEEEEKKEKEHNNAPLPSNNKFTEKIITFEDVELQLVRIPTGHCWVEGDNPEVSRDSKEYGPIPLGMVRGKVEAVIWPPSLAGVLRPHKGSTQIIYTHRRSHRSGL